MAIPRFQLGQTAILVVDVQEKLLPHMHNAADVQRQTERLLDGANLLGVPVLVTEQYVKGLGPTVPGVAARLDKAICRQEKLKFSACIDAVRQVLTDQRITHVVVCGIEAHVCVLQTCLDLAESGWVTGLCLDAIGSRRQTDHEAAVARLVQAGIVPTTVESVLLELVHEAGTERFKAMLPIIK